MNTVIGFEYRWSNMKKAWTVVQAFFNSAEFLNYLQTSVHGQPGVGGQHADADLPNGELDAATRTAAHRAIAATPRTTLFFIPLPLYFALEWNPI